MPNRLHCAIAFRSLGTTIEFLDVTLGNGKPIVAHERPQLVEELELLVAVLRLRLAVAKRRLEGKRVRASPTE